jgi:hypothetical protein
LVARARASRRQIGSEGLDIGARQRFSSGPGPGRDQGGAPSAGDRAAAVGGRQISARLRAHCSLALRERHRPHPALETRPGLGAPG